MTRFNNGHSVNLIPTSVRTKVNGKFKFTFHAPGAKNVRLVHNSRTLAQVDKDKGQFSVPAFELGRGTVTIGAKLEGIKFERERLQIGMKVPDIEGEDIDGTEFKLSDYKGKVVMIDFWGDW